MKQDTFQIFLIAVLFCVLVFLGSLRTWNFPPVVEEVSTCELRFTYEMRKDLDRSTAIICFTIFFIYACGTVLAKSRSKHDKERLLAAISLYHTASPVAKQINGIDTDVAKGVAWLKTAVSDIDTLKNPHPAEIQIMRLAMTLRKYPGTEFLGNDVGEVTSKIKIMLDDYLEALLEDMPKSILQESVEKTPDNNESLESDATSHSAEE